MRVTVVFVICLLVVCAIEGKKHDKKRDGHHKRSNHAQSEVKKSDESSDERHKALHHGKHHHHHRHLHLSKNKNKVTNKNKRMNKNKNKFNNVNKKKNTNKSKKRQFLGIRQQVREFQEKLNSMLPRCPKNDKKCAEGTCCWKGKCKMMPHRINQRCSVHCPCRDAKNNLYCHIKSSNNNRRHKYGRCYIKRKSVRIENLNFIPKTIERFRGIEKKMKEAAQKHG